MRTREGPAPGHWLSERLSPAGPNHMRALRAGRRREVASEASVLAAGLRRRAIVDAHRIIGADGTAEVARDVVEDDGTGFDVGATLESYAARGSLGLLQMRESARLIGAQLSLDSSPGQGTRVRLVIPTE